MSTFGPAYVETVDGTRICNQLRRVKAAVLNGNWWSLTELSEVTGDPESSISAQLRHLRKPRFGGYDVQKRRRVEGGGTWEYRLGPRTVLL